MNENKTIYVLDSYALLAHFRAESGGLVVRNLLERASLSSDIGLYISTINVGEIYYQMFRLLGIIKANEALTDLRQLPVTLCQATEERVLSAARIKARYPVSYADAFAIALAQEYDGLVVTGDPEFNAVDSIIEIVWL
jgi:predicted nucleic acid-binding protein